MCQRSVALSGGVAVAAQERARAPAARGRRSGSASTCPRSAAAGPTLRCSRSSSATVPSVEQRARCAGSRRRAAAPAPAPRRRARSISSASSRSRGAPRRPAAPGRSRPRPSPAARGSSRVRTLRGRPRVDAVQVACAGAARVAPRACEVLARGVVEAAAVRGLRAASDAVGGREDARDADGVLAGERAAGAVLGVSPARPWRRRAAWPRGVAAREGRGLLGGVGDELRA